MTQLVTASQDFYPGSASTSTIAEYINGLYRRHPFSGHGSSDTMLFTNVFRFFILQVSPVSSKRSNDIFLVMLPCPQVLFENVCQCYCVLKLLLSGDVELNPGPGHSTPKENYSLRTRMNDLEDKCRRDNLLFFGISEGTESIETWLQSEEKIVNIIQQKMSITLSTTDIAWAHRIGIAESTKTRPIMVKFSNYKTKEMLLNAQSKLKDSDVSMSEDFSPSTRHARKKLVEFAKATAPNPRFKLRHVRLFLNKKCYTYCAESDSVCEQTSVYATTSRVDPSAAGGSDDSR
nr:uncharacterized protein LOC126543441 [Dermacentor andersoni]